MKMRSLVGVLAAVCAVATLWTAIPALGADPAAQPPKMSPEAQKMMETYMKAGTPGPEHANMAKMVGTWDLDVTDMSGPAPMKSKGSAEFKAGLGGRVLFQTVKGDMMGMPFDGWAVMGYDNVAKKYWSLWTDSMSTGPQVSWGTCENESSCSYAGTYNDAMTGKEAKVRMTMKAAGPDQQTFEFFGPGKDGKETKMMEIVYHRHKGM